MTVRGKAHRRSVLAGCAVCVAGFGTLNVLSALGNHDGRLPGLYDYWSATVGDGLLLPLAVASLAEVLARTEPVARERGWTAAGAALGGLAGAATQIAWLADDRPALNWTLPAAHTFNAAGWYHAGFLVLMSGLFGAVGIVVGRRAVLGGPAARRMAATPGALAVLSTGAFLVCLAIDNDRSAHTDATRWTQGVLGLGVLGAAAVVGAALVRARKARRRNAL